jgi:hypothetical protein
MLGINVRLGGTSSRVGDLAITLASPSGLEAGRPDPGLSAATR